MSEYVVDVGSADAEHIAYLGVQATTVFGHPIGERVVRCRDCIKWHMYDVDEDGSMRGSCDEWTHLDGFTHATREDGFCAWGERRDA